MMNGDMLSQDEIDALLRGTDDVNDDMTKNDVNVDDLLSPMEQDALGEIGNISFGSSATALSTLLNQKVDITTPTVTIVLKNKVADEFPHPYVAIQVKYTEGFAGSNLLIIKQTDAAVIADLMLGGDGKSTTTEMLGEIQLSAVQEAMNQMMGSSATSMSTIFHKRVDISPPSIDFLDVIHGEGTDQLPNDDMLVKVSFRLKVGDLIDSNIMQLLPLDFAKSLVNELLNPNTQVAEEPVKIEEESPTNTIEQPGATPSTSIPNQEFPSNSSPYTENASYSSGQAGSMNMQQTTIENPANFQNPSSQSSPQLFGGYPGGNPPNVQPAVFSSFEPVHLQESETKNLNMLLDIPLQVTVELGRTKRSVKEILELSAGSIIELDKLAGEPVDILVNNRLIAKGEVVVIDENFGVRVTDIISQSDRLKKLR
ncbi:flagellar motor switch phosphatase FliY [Cytobacillus sp. Hz8]|uniref:flagellar motor switch phosphatase FliY n=1 Tax=Cytobacillus sp. Hz8 TaxID=3347168 RepID=UPI0035DD0660